MLNVSRFTSPAAVPVEAGNAEPLPSKTANGQQPVCGAPAMPPPNASNVEPVAWPVSRRAGWQRRMMADTAEPPASARRKKDEPYHPSAEKPKGHDPILNLNCTVKFDGTPDDVECRHLAMHWLKQKGALPTGEKMHYGRLRDATSLAKAVDPSLEGDYLHLISHAAESCIVSNERWGDFMKGQFESMQQSNQTAKRMLVCSCSHAMAMELKIKPRAGTAGQSDYAVTFYDPNLTATHKRMRTGSLGQVASTPLVSLLADAKTEADYYAEHPLSLISVVPDNVGHAAAQGGKAATAMPARSLHMITSGNTTLSVAMVHYLTESGHADALHAYFRTMVDELNSVAQRFGGDASHLMMAHSLSRAKEALLGKENEEGTTGLSASLARKDISLVRCYLSAFAQMPCLAPEARRDLFISKDGENCFAISDAFAYSQPDAVRSFVQNVLASDLPSPMVMKLLEAKMPDGAPSLHLAFANGNEETVKAFCEEVLRSDLTPQQKMHLLAAEDSDGMSGARVVFEHSDDANALTIKAFVEAVGATDTLTPEQKVDVLASRSRDGKLAIAFGHEQKATETIAAYTSAVIALGLSAAHQAALLVTEDGRTAAAMSDGGHQRKRED